VTRAAEEPATIDPSSLFERRRPLAREHATTAPAPRSVLLGATGLSIDGGIASVTRCIARALDEQIERGALEREDRVLLLDAAPPPAPPRVTQRLAHGSQARFAWQLWRQFRQGRHELAIVDHLGLARCFRLPAPGFPPRYAIFVHGGELAAAAGGARRWALAHASLLLTNSAFTASLVNGVLPEAEPRLRIVRLCIDPEKVAAWESAAVEGAARAAREPAALIVGRLWASERGKGHDALVAAWREVVRHRPEAELWIVGDGDDRARLRDEARAAGIGERVRFFGRVSDAELGELYRRASVYAMPSRQEGFGLVYAEAMWHGTPCIGSTLDAAGEVIRDGESGLLVPYGDPAALAAALVRVLADPALRARMGEAACRRARTHFTYPRFRSDLLRALGFASG
jgi:phosphatidylinositol alpha-1,6-mannosyltransferase